MEGRTLLRCRRCGRTREVHGEIPGEYTAGFAEATRAEGWVPMPGSQPAMICGPCFATFSGHETVDDEPKVRGERDPKSL